MATKRKSLLEGIAESAEWEADVISDSPSCMALIRNYEKEHHGLVRKEIKAICTDKVRTQHLFGYSGDELQTRILSMAVIRVAAKNRDEKFVSMLAKSYLRNSEREKTEPIEKSVIEILWEGIAAKPTRKELAFTVVQREVLNLASIWFFALYPYAKYDDPVKGLGQIRAVGRTRRLTEYPGTQPKQALPPDANA